MLDLSKIPEATLQPILRVVETALCRVSGLEPETVMIVGAWCRDILHTTLGHSFATAATRDLDLAIALSTWDAYRAVAAAFPRVGDTGIRFRIAEVSVDLLPFGAIEDPTGVVAPPTRGEPISVWAFEEIFASALPLALSPDVSVRIPTAAGFAAAKLAAWLDRAQWGEVKDAADLALVSYWYSESHHIQIRLYETDDGIGAFIAEDAYVPKASSHLLGLDIAKTIGPQRTGELLSRWPGDRPLLLREFHLRGGPRWPTTAARGDLLDALTRGLTDGHQDPGSP